MSGATAETGYYIIGCIGCCIIGYMGYCIIIGCCIIGCYWLMGGSNPPYPGMIGCPYAMFGSYIIPG